MSAIDSKRTRKLLWMAAFLQIVWGVVPSASQYVIHEIPVELYITLRWAISAVLFFAYLVMSKKWVMPKLIDALKVAVLGILGFGLGSIGYLYGLKIGGVANFALTGALSPIITTVIAVIFLKERPARSFLFALPLCVLGLLFLVIGKTQSASLTIALTSAGLILGAAILESTVFIFSKKFKDRVGNIEYLAIAQGSAALAMCVLQFGAYHQFHELTNLSLTGFAAAIFVSVFACVFGYAILYWLLNSIEGHKLSLFDGLHALSATLFGVLFFHEPLGAFLIAGGALIILGLLLGTSPDILFFFSRGRFWSGRFFRSNDL